MPDQQGFSLIGMLLATVVLLVVLSGGYAALHTLSRSWQHARQQDKLRQSAQLAGYMMVHAAQLQPVSMCGVVLPFTPPIQQEQGNIILRGLDHVSWVSDLEPGADSVIVPYNTAWRKGVRLILDDCQQIAQVTVTKTRKMLDKMQLTFRPKVVVVFSGPTRVGLFSQASFYVKAQGGLFVTDSKGRTHELLPEITKLTVQADNKQGMWLVIHAGDQTAQWVLPK